MALSLAVAAMALTELQELHVEVDALKAQIQALGSSRQLAPAAKEHDTFYLLWASTLVFMMQLGFAMLSAGAVRAKNVQNIMLKGLLDACLGALIWYLIGYGFAYDFDDGIEGHNANSFIGSGPSNFALFGLSLNNGYPDAHNTNYGYDWVSWFFQYAFAAAAATIVSGAVAERCQLGAYLIYTCIITGFIYPVVVHWVWDGAGFLSAFNKDTDKRWLCGMIDFAGSGVVHMTGGWAALVAAKIIRPRMGRFEADGKSYSGHSAALTVLGTFILWIGWYGFNQGSTLLIAENAETAARTGVTTTLSGSAAACLGLLLKRYLPAKLGGSPGVWDLGHTCNSLLGGLVGITAGCATVEPYSAVVIGLCASVVYHAASCLMRKLKIDDPLDAFAVHGACGLWGVIAVGFFTTETYSYATNKDGDKEYGVFYGGSGSLLGIQISGALIQILWVVGMSTPLFFILNKAGVLRVPRDVEEDGLDLSKHGGSAYESNMYPAKDHQSAKYNAN